jgi:imidazolonepropionase-like amidohydrolase
MKEGTLIGPHFAAAGPIVDGPKPIWPGSIAVTNPEEGVAAVKKVKEGGSDFVKVYSLLPRDAYFAIAAEAKRQGMAFAGHVPNSVSAVEASDAGQASIEHLTGILSACSSKEDEIRNEMLAGTQQASRFTIQVRVIESYDEKKAKALFARFVKNGTWMCPTITVLRAVASIGDEDFRNDPRLDYIPRSLKLKAGMWGENAFGLKNRSAEDNAIAKRVYEKQIDIMRAMRKSGVKFIAGTDTPNPYVFPGFSLHDELELLVKVGLSPMEALQSATSDAAEYLGRLPEVGTITKGKVADLVLLNADPLVEIGNTRKIAAVMVGGRLIERAELDGMLAKVHAANKN